MKNCVLFLFFFITSTCAFSQFERTEFKRTADFLESKYNGDDFDAIFDNSTPAMQQKISLQQVRDFFGKLKAQYGRITKREFVRFEQTGALYKTQFERGMFSIKLYVSKEGLISGYQVRAYQDPNTAKPERNITRLSLPFKDEWFVVWGGDTEEQNYHVRAENQKNAFDFVIKDAEGKMYKGNGKRNEDYYCFGRQIFAPCDGEVVQVVDGVKDNIPGVQNPMYAPGNSVLIKTGQGEFILLCHFKQHSIVVKQGQQLKRGSLLGLTGNSGSSAGPHLHFHLQNIEELNSATGIKSYFDSIWVNGQVKTDYSPVRDDKIKNVD